MGLGKVIRKVANKVLHPLHWEVVKAPHIKNSRLNMGDGLYRAAEHGIEVGTIIDVGASDGKWSKMALKRFSSANVLAFEPLEERRGDLEKVKSTCHGFDFVLAVAGDSQGETRLHVASDLDGSGVCESEGDQSRKVPMTTIDHEVRTRGLPGPYLIKLDTHGFELPILDGAVETIRQSNLIIIEVYNFKLNERCLRFHEMCEHMESLGFRCYDLVDPLLRARDKALWQMDMFFAPVETGIFENACYQ